VDEDNSIAIQPGNPPNMRWLLRKRTESELGPNGWDKLVGEKNITIEVIESATHFGMLKEPSAGRVSSFMKGVAKPCEWECTLDFFCYLLHYS